MFPTQIKNHLCQLHVWRAGQVSQDLFQYTAVLFRLAFTPPLDTIFAELWMAISNPFAWCKVSGHGQALSR